MMVKKGFIFFCCVNINLFFSQLVFAQDNIPTYAITYRLNGGRLGDCVQCFCLAKWLSYKYKMRFYYVPFLGSEALALGKYEKPLTKKIKRLFEEIVTVKTEKDIVSQLKKGGISTLFVVSFRAKIDTPQDDPIFTEAGSGNLIYLLMKKFPIFGADVQRDLQLRKKPQPMNFPENMITVAVHVRKGGGFDAPLESNQYFDEIRFSKVASDRIHPAKFPPEQYYIEQIEKVSELLNDAPLFVGIFTDDQNPGLLLERFKKRINRPHIMLSCAHEGCNVFQKNVLNDIYQMSLFDCLIKSSSKFAWVSQLIGSHKMIVHVRSALWDNAKKMVIVTNVGVLFNDSSRRSVKYMPFMTLNQDYQKIASDFLKLI